MLELVSKPRRVRQCPSERSEESRILKDLRSFAAFRMTRKIGFATASNLQNDTSSHI
jgi:hypothetical protein